MSTAPCPFCGGGLVELHIYETSVLGAGTGPRRLFVLCRNCSARGPAATTDTQAWEAWNQRTPAPERP